MLAQVAGTALDEDAIASVVAALGSSRQPVAIDKARLDRQIRELALEHAAGILGDEACIARLKALRQQRDAVEERTTAGLPPERTHEWLCARVARGGEAARVRPQRGAFVAPKNR